MIRLVVTDLDGTFWGRDLVVPDAHLVALEQLAVRGVDVMVATSRRRRVAAEHLGRSGLVPAAVVLDGAMGVDLETGERFHDAAFPVDAATHVLSLFRRHGLEPCVYVDEAEVDVVLSSEPSTSSAHVEYLGEIARTGDLDVLCATPGVYGFSVMGRRHDELEPLAALLASYGAELMLFAEAQYGGWSLVVAPPGVTKWSGVLAYCRPSAISADEILAVGDGDNDLDMLKRAGVAVGVRGGSERALAMSDHVIDGPDSGGWAAIVRLVDASLRS